MGSQYPSPLYEKIQATAQATHAKEEPAINIKESCQLICGIVMYLLYGSNTLSITAVDKIDSCFKAYIKSILSCTTNNVTLPVIMVSLLYVAKYVEYYVGLVNRLIEPDSQERIWTAALMMADSFMNDSAYATKSWALVSRIPVEECVMMRRSFMEVLDYDLAIKPSKFSAWVGEVQSIYSMLKLNAAAAALHLKRPSHTMTPPLIPIPTASFVAPIPSSQSPIYHPQQEFLDMTYSHQANHAHYPVPLQYAAPQYVYYPQQQQRQRQQHQHQISRDPPYSYF